MRQRWCQPLLAPLVPLTAPLSLILLRFQPVIRFFFWFRFIYLFIYVAWLARLKQIRYLRCQKRAKESDLSVSKILRKRESSKEKFEKPRSSEKCYTAQRVYLSASQFCALQFGFGFQVGHFAPLTRGASHRRGDLLERCIGTSFLCLRNWKLLQFIAGNAINIR